MSKQSRSNTSARDGSPAVVVGPSHHKRDDADFAAQSETQDPAMGTLRQIRVSDGHSIQPQVSLLRDTRLSKVQRGALARAIGSLQGNRHLNKVLRTVHTPSEVSATVTNNTIQRSPLSDELEQIWTVEGKGAFFDRLRTLDQSDIDLVDWVNRNLTGDDLWLATNIMNHGPEANWPVPLQVEREFKAWSGRVESTKILEILGRASSAEFDLVMAAMTRSQTSTFFANLTITDELVYYRLVERIRTARMMYAAGELVGETATWVPSGAGSGNTFETWASAATETAAPPINSVTAINCWEMVLMAAFNAGLVNWQWIHDLYTTNVGPGWYTHLENTLIPGSQTTFDPANPATTPRPTAGQIVMWDGAAHVGLALGSLDGVGRSQVFSFWPPPNTAFTAGGTVDSVKITTIEELYNFMDADPRFTTPTVTFGSPPW